jgi:tRNA pseudouridine synthase 10
MLEEYPLCDHCLGRQFALLGHGIENDARGKSIKLALVLSAHADSLSRIKGGKRILEILASNGFSKEAQEILQMMKKHTSSKNAEQACFLCKGKFDNIESLVERALHLLEAYEYGTFLVGIELPTASEECEDEFKARFEVHYGESMRNEFGRLTGKRIVEHNKKAVEFLKPEIVVLVNPFAETVKLQVNPLFVAGRYRKLARGIPQSKWFCSNCWGRGCEKCSWTGKMYSESVEELIGKILLDATGGLKTSFHASGREDIDARMLGTGRPFVIEVTRPQERFLDLAKLKQNVNSYGKGKIEVSNLKFADKDLVRRLKKGESTQKEYRVIIEFENRIVAKDLKLLKERLANGVISQKTPVRVLHRRADLTRERYIYEVGVKKLSPKKAELILRCQGGLYVKELVTGDEGRTTPSVSGILENKAKPMKLDVLSVDMGD